MDRGVTTMTTDRSTPLESHKLTLPCIYLYLSTSPTHRAGLTYGFMDNTPVDQMYNEAYILNPHEELEPKIKRVAKLPLTNQPGAWGGRLPVGGCVPVCGCTRPSILTNQTIINNNHKTGAKWNYGLSTDVLILIASKVTGLSVEGFMQERLFGTCWLLTSVARSCSLPGLSSLSVCLVFNSIDQHTTTPKTPNHRPAGDEGLGLLRAQGQGRQVRHAFYLMHVHVCAVAAFGPSSACVWHA